MKLHQYLCLAMATRMMAILLLGLSVRGYSLDFVIS